MNRPFYNNLFQIIQHSNFLNQKWGDFYSKETPSPKLMPVDTVLKELNDIPFTI